ncbi:hypothetical protein H2198_003112 [Neophaeococcomyces mojaviensis]|uniref:Uncharacterized protein n=1 Tax=Neophaeococcomyces mojaviensis TaxID=3383035 RepID=A0ACC3AC43_9EURO|nr:hypothetical protein H2198_003112 [Knufia sp. JES_112]
MDVPGFAVITGAASGIGRACSKAFARDGSAGIALLDLSYESLLAVKAEIEEEQKKQGGKCQIEVSMLDVTDEAQVDRIINQIAQKFGRIDYVVNAAGIAFKHQGGAAYAETKDWQRVLNVNLNGTFYILRAAAKIMLKQERILSSIDGRPLQRGSIVNLASILGTVAVPTSTAYTASKHGVIGLTRTASEDYAKDGLRINAVCPGYIGTPMTLNNPSVSQTLEERVQTFCPMKRLGEPQEIADGVVYLSGGRSSFVTGTALVIDGGYTQR